MQKPFSGENISFSENDAWTLDLYWFKKNEHQPKSQYYTNLTYVKVNSKCVTDLNVKWKIIKFMETIGENYWDL